MIAEMFLTTFVTILVVYAVVLHFNWCSCLVSLAITCLVYAGFRDKLAGLVDKAPMHWTMIGLFVIFISSFEHTKHDNGLYLFLAIAVVLSVLSFFVKNTFFIMLSLFFFLYMALDLLTRHLARCA